MSALIVTTTVFIASFYLFNCWLALMVSSLRRA